MALSVKKGTLMAGWRSRAECRAHRRSNGEQKTVTVAGGVLTPYVFDVATVGWRR